MHLMTESDDVHAINFHGYGFLSYYLLQFLFIVIMINYITIAIHSTSLSIFWL